MRSTAKTVTIWVGTLLSLTFAYLALRGIKWQEAWHYLKGTQWMELGSALALMWAGFFWRAIRWKRLIDTGKPISFKDCFKVITIGYMANNLLPARIGEFARAYILSSKNGVTKSFALGTIVTERLGDVIMLVLLISTTLILLPVPIFGKEVALGSAIIALTGTTVLVATVIWQETVQGAMERMLPVLIGENHTAFVVDKVHRFLVGVSCGRSVRILGLIGFDSLVIWGTAQLMTWEVAKACHVNVSLSQILFVMCVVNLGAMLPSAPGYVGTYQYSCMLALGFFGVDKELALAFSIVSHVVWYVPLTLLGLIFFLHDRLSWKQLSEDEPEDEPN